MAKLKSLILSTATLGSKTIKKKRTARLPWQQLLNKSVTILRYTERST